MIYLLSNCPNTNKRKWISSFINTVQKCWMPTTKVEQQWQRKSSALKFWNPEENLHIHSDNTIWLSESYYPCLDLFIVKFSICHCLEDWDHNMFIWGKLSSFNKSKIRRLFIYLKIHILLYSLCIASIFG